MSRFASCSHTGSVGHLGGYLQRLLNRFGRDSAFETFVDFVETHPGPKALEDVHYGEPRTAGFPPSHSGSAMIQRYCL
jgi:hypothetical protein